MDLSLRQKTFLSQNKFLEFPAQTENELLLDFFFEI